MKKIIRQASFVFALATLSSPLFAQPAAKGRLNTNSENIIHVTKVITPGHAGLDANFTVVFGKWRNGRCEVKITIDFGEMYIKSGEEYSINGDRVKAYLGNDGFTCMGQIFTTTKKAEDIFQLIQSKYSYTGSTPSTRTLFLE